MNNGNKIYDVSRWEKKKGDTVKFSCRCQIDKVEQRQAENGNIYHVITSTNKVRFVCFNDALITQINYREQDEKITLKGKLNFVMGSTYLLLTEVLTLSLQAGSLEKDFFDVIPQGEKEIVEYGNNHF